ncbi:DUF1353 domain-containing protein [Metapseudomonas otitidis]|uniref:DUF1353 domain-containing protein n=1 Tax=Metapseudomonas otitidis TaxID=319939 RepID=UPI001F10B181|nr:DUF1353 domain-containing protein [Pseudomonas otitidis]
MKRFPMPLQVEQLNDGTWRLLAPFLYQDPGQGLIQVPGRFDTDFASVRPLRNLAVILLGVSLAAGGLGLLLDWPFLVMSGAALGAFGFGSLLLYAAVVGYGNGPAVIHDYLYGTANLSRRQSDEVFYNALRSSGVARWRAWLMWAGVRIGGHWRYGP